MMIRHIIKIVWNERRSNILIFLEFIVVFCVFWFCCDYLYYLASRYFEPQGYDIEHTYLIKMELDDNIEENEDERYNYAMTLQERLKNYPGVEAISFSSAAIPFGWSMSSWSYLVNNDSIRCSIVTKEVSAGYFDVFKLGIKQGRGFNELDIINESKVALVSSDRYGYFRDKNHSGLPIEEVKELSQRENDEDPYVVVGITEIQKRNTFEAFESTKFRPLGRSKYNCVRNEIAIRVSPAADDEEFIERFTRDMKEQLLIGPYYLDNVTSLQKRKKLSIESSVGNELKSVLAITVFLFINIFLGIIGTFWSRTESRKSEIGLRLAMGSTKRKVRWQMFAETMILLLIASLIGAYICVNLGQSEILTAIRLPMADYKAAGFGSGHYFVNYGITLLLLTLISGLAVWYPSRLASKIQPAETLRAE